MSEFQQPPQGLIFDMDGTLVDNMQLHNRIWAEFLAELGVPVDPATFHEQTAGKTSPEILRLFLGDDLPDSTAAQHVQEKEARYRRQGSQVIQPLHGLLPFLERARQAGLRMAVATSAGQENVAFILVRLGLAPFFQAVVSEEDITRSKPDPQGFLLAAQRLKLAPEHCLAFEDSYKGIQAAHNAGMPVVAVLTELSQEQARALPGVIATINDYTQMNGFLRW